MLIIRSLSKRMFFFFLLIVVSPSMVVVVTHDVGKPFSRETSSALQCNKLPSFFFPLYSRHALLLLRGKLNSYSVIVCFITGLRNSRQTTPQFSWLLIWPLNFMAFPLLYAEDVISREKQPQSQFYRVLSRRKMPNVTAATCLLICDRKCEKSSRRQPESLLTKCTADIGTALRQTMCDSVWRKARKTWKEKSPLTFSKDTYVTVATVLRLRLLVWLLSDLLGFLLSSRA